MQDETSLLALFTAELVEAEKQGDGIELNLRPSSAFMLLANLQLALRHPQNTGAAAKLAQDVCRIIETHFSKYPAMSDLMKRGWYEQYYDNFDKGFHPR